MKELMNNVTNNVKSGWKSTFFGVLFLAAFAYEYFTKEKIDLISMDSALLALGVSFIFAPDPAKKKVEAEEKKE